MTTFFPLITKPTMPDLNTKNNDCVSIACYSAKGVFEAYITKTIFF